MSLNLVFASYTKDAMTKRDFFDLLVKFEKGKCSKKEEDLLFAFYETFQKDNVMDSWSLSDKEQTRIKLFHRINKSIRDEKRNKTIRQILVRSLRIAALFIGLIGIGYVYEKISSSSTVTITPTDAITLEFEDGNIKTILEDGSEKILDSHGNIVGQQKDGQLVYKQTNVYKKLIYNTLTVPYGKTFKLLLSDGTVAHLNSGSSLKYPVQFLENMERKVFVTGEAFLDVAKDPEHPFTVHANNLNIRVLGTRFNVNAYPEDENTRVVLVEGLIGLYVDAEEFSTEESTYVEPGHQASLDKKSNEIKISQVSTDIYTSWVNGELVFRDMTFDNILKKMERHFNVKIINKNKTLSKEKFNAGFGLKPNIYEVLEELKTIYHITFTIEDNTVIIN
ncbi:FecR family protein [Maribacter sp. 2304DJ31-5]|uniref:FecR family protein n=1 Tax=Maribacter sp. 2304DJ31-5 TaxID=3386273 RepID=UPI0039BD2146